MKAGEVPFRLPRFFEAASFLWERARMIPSRFLRTYEENERTLAKMGRR
jgi:hypothetical protein